MSDILPPNPRIKVRAHPEKIIGHVGPTNVSEIERTYVEALQHKPKEYDFEKMKESVRLFFEAIGDDPNRDGIKDTPERVAKMYKETMNGYFLDPRDYLTKFENDGGYHGPVILRDAELYTVCEHHLQPFAGTIDIAYQPGEHIIGLSKLLRVARVYAKRPQVQERLTQEVSAAINELLEPAWCFVRIRAEHHCMKLRGVRVNGSYTETYAGYGDYPQGLFNG